MATKTEFFGWRRSNAGILSMTCSLPATSALIAGTFSRLKPLMLRTVSEVVCIEVDVDKAALRLTTLGQGF